MRHRGASAFGLSLLLLMSLGSHGMAQPPIVYDAFADFSFVSNPTPGGMWSYGYSIGLGGPLNLYTFRNYELVAPGWRTPDSLDPNIFKNDTGTDIVWYGDILVPGSDFLYFHPGLNGDFSVMRWTAPTSARYLLDSTFRSLRIAGDDTTTDVHILAVRQGDPPSDSSILFSAMFDSNDDVFDFSTEVQVEAGQGVDFVVGFGSTGGSTGVRASLTPLDPQACVADATSMCLNAGRFRVTADWRKTDGTAGSGEVVRLTADSGYFWFFNPANIEVVIKVLNACGISNHYWIFAAGLTNVEVTLRVADTQTGSVQTYVNPLGTAYEPIQDTSAFETCP